MRKLSILLLFAITLSACGAPAAPDIDELGTRVAATLQAAASSTVAAVPSATTEPTATLFIPTFTPTALPTSTPEQGRLNFATGATQGVVADRVEANQVVSYTARAAQGQVMILNLSNGNAILEVVGADGSTVLARSNRYISFRSVLTKTQDYTIRVIGGGNAQDFTLSVVFAVPVAFASGADSASYEGQTVGGYPVTYALYVRENQDLHVRLDTNSSDAALTVWGFDDGNPYARAQNGVTNFSLDVPETQYYIIEVVPQGGRVIDYEIEVEVN